MIVDSGDKIRVACRKWRQHKGYWITSLYMDFQNRPVFLHNYLLGMPLDRTLEVDHINRNPSDNRKANLRFVTHRENMQNLSLDKRNKAGLTGISPITARTVKRGKEYTYEYWRAQTRKGGKLKTLGYFKTKQEAIQARLNYENSTKK